MKHIKIICAIAAAALLTGCADEAVSSATTQTTAQTTTTAETTIQTTTAATTTTATTAETTVTEATTAQTTTTSEQTTTQPVEAETPTEDETALADTDILNPDGTYTVDASKLTVDTKEDSLPSTLDWSMEYYDWFVEGINPNPSKIPYSEITLENAAEAFPFLGYTGKYPNYIEILPTDDADAIARKVRENLIGESSTSYMGGSDLWQYHNFKSQAEYDAYLVEQERLAAEAEAFGDQIEAARTDGTSIGDGITSEEAEDLTDLVNSLLGR